MTFTKIQLESVKLLLLQNERHARSNGSGEMYT